MTAERQEAPRDAGACAVESCDVQGSHVHANGAKLLVYDGNDNIVLVDVDAVASPANTRAIAEAVARIVADARASRSHATDGCTNAVIDVITGTADAIAPEWREVLGRRT